MLKVYSRSSERDLAFGGGGGIDFVSSFGLGDSVRFRRGRPDTDSDSFSAGDSGRGLLAGRLLASILFVEIVSLTFF